VKKKWGRTEGRKRKGYRKVPVCEFLFSGEVTDRYYRWVPNDTLTFDTKEDMDNFFMEGRNKESK